MFHYSYINLLLVSPNSSLFLHAGKDFSKFLPISSDASEGSIKFDSDSTCALTSSRHPRPILSHRYGPSFTIDGR